MSTQLSLKEVRVKKRKVELRKFPYPYRAALTILSDFHDGLDAQSFLSMYRFLNTEDDTSLGKGIGLEVAASFWFYSPTSRFTYFDGYTGKPSKYADLIRRLIHAGYIDSLHTYGDFTEKRFTRKFAVDAVKELKQIGSKILVWVNHGDQNNTQSVNAAISHHRGAKVDAEEYHLDLLLDSGIRFLWNTHLTDIIGQDRKIKLQELPQLGRKHSFKFLGKIIKILSRVVRIHDINQSNILLRPFRLDDGQIAYAFKRFNNHPGNLWNGVRADDLPRQISSEVLKKLEEVEGYLIVYNHLEEGFPWHTEVVGALHNLANAYRKGKIFVTTTSRLLMYNLIHNHLRYSSENRNGVWILRINPAIQDKVFRSYDIKLEDLQGITFYTPDSQNAHVYLGDKEIQNIARNPRDFKGRESVSIPFIPLRFPDRIFI